MEQPDSHPETLLDVGAAKIGGGARGYREWKAAMIAEGLSSFIESNGPHVYEASMKRFGEERPKMAAPAPDKLRDLLVRSGAGIILKENPSSYAQFAAAMEAKGFGDIIKPYGSELFRDSKCHHDSVMKKGDTEREPELATFEVILDDLRAAAAEDDAIYSEGIRGLALLHIHAGITDADELVQRVKVDLLDIYPDITIREVAESMCGNDAAEIKHDPEYERLASNLYEAKKAFYRLVHTAETDSRQRLAGDYSTTNPSETAEANERWNQGYNAFKEGQKHEAALRKHEALNCYDTANKCGFEDAGLFSSRAWLLNGLGWHLDAIEDFDKAILLEPQDCNLYFGRAMSKMQTGDQQGSRADFQEAIRLSKVDNGLNTKYSSGAKDIGRVSHTAMYEQQASISADMPEFIRESYVESTKLRGRRNK
jgi:tetratricopeptide (TPR) repeat protein